MITRIKDYVIEEINKNTYKYIFLSVAWIVFAVIMFTHSDLPIYAMLTAVVLGGIMGFVEIFFIIIPIQRRLDRVINKYRAAE